MIKKNDHQKRTNSLNEIKNVFTEDPVFYKHLVELAPEAIVIHSEGKIIYINPAAKKLVGVKSTKEIIGKSVMDFVHPDSLPLIRERIKNMLNKKKVAPLAVEKFITLKGDIIFAETKAIPFIFKGKSSILAVLHNITDKKKEEEQQYFLNNISKLLSSSIEYKKTLENVVKCIVPALADYSRLVLLNENGSLLDEVSYHIDPKKLEYVKKLYEAYGNRSDYIYGVGNILSTGKSEIIENVSSAFLKKYKTDRQVRKIINALELTSYMGVPLKVQNKIIGALTFSSIRKDRIYTNSDLRFVEEVARRISSAIENARLYAQAQKIIEAEERLSAIVAFSDDAIISKTLDGIITSWNKSAEKVFGHSASEAIGKHITLIIPKNLWPEEKLIISNIKKGRHMEHYETVRVRKDGRQIFVSLTISAIKDSQGKIIGASKIARDITDKKKTENELIHLASLVESSSDAIWSTTLDNKILSWNKGAEMLYGYPAKDVLGHNIINLVVPKEKIEERGNILEKVRHGEQIVGLETVHLTKDKKNTDVSMTVSPLKDPQGSIVGISAIVRNISTQKEQENLKDEFISMASHELKTPITSMKMFLDILSNYLGEEDSNAQSYVKRIKDQTNKMKDLVNDLLDVSRIGTGKLRFNNEKFQLDEIVKDTIESIQPAAKKHRMVFKNSVPLQVYGDKFRIYQVVTNLLNNAIKYSPKSNKIIVTAKIVKGDAVVSVKDFGIGIAKEKQQKIFEKLYQVTDPEEKTFPGLGMGLYISQEIINRHDGKMWVKSKKGKGSTFCFSLKLKRT